MKLNGISELFKKYVTGEKVTVRLFSALFITCSIFLSFSKYDFTSEDYFKNIVYKWTSGQYVKGILKSGLVQTHLPALVKEDLLGVYPMFTI